ncbi:MAG: DUF4249 family protein [Balneola sp.]|nr:MAG: DUF4249 family protein [Balneola sp.]
MKNLLLLLTSSILVLTACDDYSQGDYEEFYVVESYLIAGRALQQVRLSTTAPAFEFYSFENTAVEGANVVVRLLEENGTGIDSTFTFGMRQAGIYIPDSPHIVLPSRTYRLEVLTQENEEISATAIVPGNFTVVGGILDTLVYQSTDQLEVTLSESSYPGRQNVYIFNTLAVNPDPDNLTPLYADFYDGEDDLQEFSNTASGLLNEGNFDVNSDGSITVRYPWIAVAFYGENDIVASTVDDNIFDYVRSEEVQLGGSTLSPGEIQNVITHVEGGIGLFGAMASDTIRTFIRRNPDF